MTITRLALQSFRHYRRTHAAVGFGVAAAVAVMAGALLVGHSVRASLASITTGRLGRTGVVIGAETPFTEPLGERIRTSLGVEAGDAAALLMLEGLTRHEASGRRAGRVSIYGVDERFFRFHGVDVAPPTGSEVLLSPDLAAELGAAAGDTVIVRVARPTDVPLDSLHGRKDDTGRSLRMTARETLPRESMGEFSLSAEQGPVRAAFVPLDRLQRDLDLDAAPPRVNTLLVAAAPDAAGPTATAVRAALVDALDADDIGLTFDAHPDQGVLIVESASGLITEALQTSVETLAARESIDSTPVLTWLANRITVGDRSTPYSLLSAIGPDAGGDEALARLLAPAAGGVATPIVFNDWLARDLQTSPGDAVEIEYYRWADEGRLVSETASFRVAGSVPIRGLAADRRLAPDYPGISDSDNLGDWDPPFPIDLGLVRPIDEDYWDEYRATPKAFIPLDAGQALWRTRYGQTSSLRLRPAEAGAAAPAAATAADLDAVAQELRQRLPRSIDPGRAGIGVADVRAQNLAASVGATDFGAYFFYFSFFLVVSAILLAALFFRLSVEQRLPEIGLLRAEGFPLGTVRRVFLIEGAMVSALGAVAGVVLALAWAGLMMYGLRTWWVGAVGTTLLTLHVDAVSLLVGAAGGALAGLASLALTIRGLSRRSPRALVAGDIRYAGYERYDGYGRYGKASVVAVACLGLAVALSGASLAGLVPPAGGFFGAGALALVGGIAAFRRWLTRPAPGGLARRGTSGLVRLGLQNASWRPGRSLTAAALVAAAVFLLVSVDAFRKGAGDSAGPASGTGGFQLIAESALPLVHDPATPEGRDALGLEFPPGEPELEGVRFIAARLRPGDDASCLNLFQPKQPRVMAVPATMVEANRFSFSASMSGTEAESANPWRLLGPPDADGIVPAILDATSLQYVFHAAVGDVITIDVETTRPVQLRIVAALSDSMLQGEILIGESAFAEVYPGIEGYRLLLVEVGDPAPERVDDVARFIEDRLEPYGVDAQDSARRLEAFHRVENTYLSTFQTLGGLGLVLGSFGLAAIVARNVLERRRELALLGAAGYTGGQLQTVVLAEHLALVAAGLLVGVAAALVAIAPVLIARGGGLPGLPLVWIAIVAVTGLVASLGATRGVRRMPLVPALRSE
jgi:ABC-type lipoprotein release transport system permease subunit